MPDWGYVLVFLVVAIALSLLLFALLARSARRRQLDKLGPRALENEFKEQREARRG